MEGDSVIADKGFLVKQLLSEKNISLNIPPFLQGNRPFSPAECSKTEEIASHTIHVKRYIGRMKENKLFDSEIPFTLAGSINQYWAVACLLAHLKGPFII